MHERVVNESEEETLPGVRDAGALEAAVARPYSGFGGVDFYPTPFAKAAALMESISQRHPFVDGNKRTGLLAAALSLRLAGYTIVASQLEQADIAVKVAEHQLGVDGLAKWLEKNSFAQST